MNKIAFFLLLLLSFNRNCPLSAQDISYDLLRSGFDNPADRARPKVYWWCLNGNIDTIRAKKEFLAMKEAGIAGFDMFEIGVPAEDTMIPGGPAFMSDESLKIIKFVICEAGKSGLETGLNLASSWNAGGAWTLPENAGKSLYCSKIFVKGGAEKQSIIVPFPEISFPESSLIGGTGRSLIPFRPDGRPVYHEEVALLAIPAEGNKNFTDADDIIDVSGFFDPVKDLLDWKVPSGEWEIHRFVCSNSGQQLVLPSPNSAGLTIDHFDSTAVSTHLLYIINRLKLVLGDFSKTALKSLYLASYEARGFVWTPSLRSEFKKLNGYDIVKYLPSFFTPELFSKEINEKIQKDFKKTLSELMIRNLYRNSKMICNRYGLKINCEAGGPGYPLYNGPAEPLKALGALDIPRGEFWINHSRFYKDPAGNDTIDILRVVKEVSAASHIYGKGITEEESFTSFQHWQEGPVDMKPFGDRAFCEGMNRVVFHGFSHNPEGTGYPGIVYHAGTHFNDKRVWWPKVRPFVDYLSRISYIFQETKFVSDVLYYYGDKIPNSATPKNTHFIVGPGYDYEVVNTEILLNDVTVKNGELFLPGGAHFSVLALESEAVINPLVLAKLTRLARQGAKIVGTRPEKVSDLTDPESKAGKDAIQTEKLWLNVNGLSDHRLMKKGKVFSGISPLGMLKALGIPPDFSYPDKKSFILDFIHYQITDIDFYFIRNTTAQWISRECEFRQQSKVPEIWNPVTGEIVNVPVYFNEGKIIRIPLTLPPYGSYFVVFKDGNSSAPYTSVISSGKYPPLMEFTSDGILFLDKGTFTLESRKGNRLAESIPEIQNINGPWNVTFRKGWGAPDTALFPELSSWTVNKNEGIRYYSGVASYSNSFNYENSASPVTDQKVFLDLGELSKVAEVWLNGQSIGITWTKPFRYDITGKLKAGQNILRIEVANTWSNRLTGDAITGERYTNTNITNTNIPGTDRTSVPWAETPLIESGLMGPVTIEIFTLFK